MLQEPKAEIIDEIYKNKSLNNSKKLNSSDISKNSKNKINGEDNFYFKYFNRI